MANIITSTDFVGKYQVTQNPKKKAKIESYIENCYRTYIYQILGAVMGKEFIADLEANNGVPIIPKFVELYVPFVFDESNCFIDGVRESIGMKNIILGLVYLDITRDANFYNSAAGNKKVTGENSVFADMRDKCSENWKKSIVSVTIVQWYICELNRNAKD